MHFAHTNIYIYILHLKYRGKGVPRYFALLAVFGFKSLLASPLLFAMVAFSKDNPPADDDNSKQAKIFRQKQALKQKATADKDKAKADQPDEKSPEDGPKSKGKGKKGKEAKGSGAEKRGAPVTSALSLVPQKVQRLSLSFHGRGPNMVQYIMPSNVKLVANLHERFKSASLATKRGDKNKYIYFVSLVQDLTAV